MKRWLLIGLLMLTVGKVQAQTDEEQLAYFMAQIDSAQREKNALKAASAYGKVVVLCRRTPSFENKLTENLYNYGMWSTYAGNHQTAIDVLIELLDMPDNPDDTSLFTLKARACNGLGMICFFLERWDDALAHYQKTRDMAIELQNELGVSIAENNIGNIYQKKGNYQTAIEHYRRCLQLQEAIDDKETICNTYFNLGTCYFELGNFDEGFPYVDLALNMAREIGDREIEALCLIRLAQYNAQEKRQFMEASNQLVQAEQIAQETGYRQVLNEVYHTRSIVEEKYGDFASALEYFKKYKMLADTLFNEKSVNQLQEYQVRYQTAEKELEIERQQVEINRHKTRQFVLTGGLLAAGLLLVMLVYVIGLRTRRNRELSDMNAIKDKFFSIISHDLKNPAIAQRDALQILADNANIWDVGALVNYHHKLLKSANGLVELLKNLLNWAQIQTGRKVFHPQPMNLVAALQPDLDLIHNMAEEKGIIFNVQMPKTALVTGDEPMLTTVVRNLLANAVKFTTKGGTITLDISQGDARAQDAVQDAARDAARHVSTSYVISVSDTGTGMNREQIDNLFRLDKTQSRRGTAGEQGSGLGLIVCKELLEKHGSTLYVESEEGKGSRLGFELRVES